MFNWMDRIPFCRQWQAGLILSLGTVLAGHEAGWTSPYIAKLSSPNSTHRLKLTTSDASWITSLRFIGRVIGTIIGATIQGYIGRKKMLLLMSVPMAAGWALIIFAPDVKWLFASRILTGIATGIVLCASASFLGEIADPLIRGALITLIPNGLTCGALLGSIMGGFLPLETFSYICLGLIGLFFSIFIFVPESPYYHIANGNSRKAEKSLRWYKPEVNVKRETEELKKMIGSENFTLAQIFNEFKKREHMKNFFIINLLTAFPYLAGMNTTDAYAEIILTKSKIDVKPSVIVMALTFTATFAGIVPIILVDKIGRKLLLIGSGIGLTIGHILLGSHFHLLSLGIHEKTINWLPIFSLFIVYVSLSCGLATIKDSLLGELFPPILKTPASFTFAANTGITSFVVSKCFQPYVDFAGEKYVFWTFATVAMLSVVFSFFFIPETTRMKLIDIQDNLKNNCKENNKAKV